MVIKHRPGRKLYCSDSLSRRRQVAGDNTDPFFVEPGVLFKIAQDSGSVPRDEARHATEQSEQDPLAVHTLTHARDALERAKRQYERIKRRAAERFQVGDLVLLSTKNLNLKIAARKLLCKFVGPFEVLAPPEHATNPNVMWLKTPPLVSSRFTCR